MTREQARWAYRAGVARSREARGNGQRHRFGYRPTMREEDHIGGMSAVAEYAVALATRRPWIAVMMDGPDDPIQNDIWGGISVRWTPRADGSLIVHEDEPDHLKCVLVVGESFPVTVIGWMPITECKRRQFWRTNVRHPAFFVPQHIVARRKISELLWQPQRESQRVTSG